MVKIELKKVFCLAVVIFGLADNATNVAVICPANNTEATAALATDAGDAFHHFWQQDLSVPLYLIIPFIFLLNVKNAAIFSYFNSFGKFVRDS